ncbi:MAG: M50 family metallopeptidase [Erythrobacter sp.]|uniref:Peptidase_M50 domain-containing protein n=1 Tax=Erythrobacter dokdonensis DSW-74 TaxID=1300349 RepID=A0A1A7BBJ5_9SPHN|nr:M50 family metallopeptidase [Erythrobacter sp.]OBV09913.1 Peptidase_M50 domain-containing protein [Erythrobacter dokdonensis DSW-74]
MVFPVQAAVSSLGDRIVYALWYLASAALWVTASKYEAFGDNWLIAFAAIAALQFVIIVIHELGHALAAWRSGARVDAICAVPFVWDTSRRAVRFEPELPAHDIGGYVSYTFEAGGSTRKDMAIAAAGPLSNFASAAVVAGLAALLSASVLPSGERADPDPLQISAVDTDAPPRATRPAIRLPSEAEIEAMLETDRARRRREALADWGEALSELFIALSVILGLLNLVPHRGSDGAAILAGWRVLRGR